MKQVSKLNPFGRFCCTIGNLPTSYMESLTYEEQLMWFCRFLDEKVIPAVNENADAIIELQNYLKNLDLQDEVNIKLDEMVEDGTLGQIINQELFSDLDNRVTTNTNDITTINNTIITYPYFDVLKNGGYADDSTPNDTIISNALLNGYKKFYFPQNSANNASYYFTNFPTLNNCEIITDDNVQLNFPSSFGINDLKDTILNSNLKVYARQEDIAYICPKNKTDFFNSLHVTSDYRLKKLTAHTFSSSALSCYKYNYGSTYLFESIDKTTYYEEDDLFMNRILNSGNNLFNGLTVDINDNVNCIETATNGNNANPEFVVLNKDSGVGIFGGYSGSDIYYWKDNASSTTLQSLNIFNHNVSLNNDYSKKMMYKMRYDKNKNSIQFIINGCIVTELELDFTPTSFGYGFSGDTSTALKLMRFVTYYQENLPLNYNLNVLIVGDSRFAGDGQVYKIDEILKTGLLYNGINNVNIDNQAVSGHTLSQIKSVLQTNDLSDYDVIIFEGGINNYNDTSSSIAYQMADISQLLQNSGALVVFTTCMPCGWGGSDAAADNRASAYYGIVNSMNVGIGSFNNTNTFIVIDNNMGNTKYDSNIPVCNDGVHPNDLGLIEIVRNIIAGLFNHFKI